MSEIQYQLIVRKGPTVGEIISLDLPIITIGRDPVADVVLNDPEISRQHTRFMRTPDGFSIQDLGSTNGTFVNGERIGGEAIALQAGQTVSMGSGVTLIFEQLAPEDVPTEDGFDLDTAVEVETAPPDAFFYVPADDEADEPIAYEAPTYEPIINEPAAYNSYDNDPIVTDDNNNSTQKRNIAIFSCLGLTFCCFCSFIPFMWFYGGDWLLQQMGLIP